MKQSNNTSVSPAHVVLAPTDKLNILNFSNFSEVGSKTYAVETAFKKTQTFFKKANVSPADKRLTSISSQILPDYIFNHENQMNNDYSFGTQRQHNLSSLKSLFNNSNTLIDQNSFDKMLNYSQSTNLNNSSFEDNLSVIYENKYGTRLNPGVLNLFNLVNGNFNNTNFSKFLNYPSRINNIMFDTDVKKKKRPFSFILHPYRMKKGKHFELLLTNNEVNNFFSPSDIDVFADSVNITNPAYDVLNKGNNYSIKDLKSNNMDISKTNSNPRLLETMASKKSQHNFNKASTNNMTSVVDNTTNDLTGVYSNILTS